jgi:hypothetical protein
MAMMLGTADLIGQMADRTYLEKLLFLYIEFKEGNVDDYDSELDLLQKTATFYDFVKERLQKDLGDASRFMLPHFKKRWNIDVDLYYETMERNIVYLRKILKDYTDCYRDCLRRGNIIEKIEKREMEEGDLF